MRTTKQLKIALAPLRHFDDRPPQVLVDTVIIHSMYAKGAANELSEESCVQILDEHKVAAHYLIGRRGRVLRMVDEEKRAWHAGQSQLPFPDDTRTNVNHFSIGIELVGYEDRPFTNSQYSTLAQLITSIAERHPITTIIGHADIAPQRKSDPGPRFSWARLRTELSVLNAKTKRLRFPI